jgi:hypothetical protein
MEKKISPWQAMRISGITREYLRPMCKTERHLAWAMIVMNAESEKHENKFKFAQSFNQE